MCGNRLWQIALVIILLFTVLSFAGEVKLTWSPNLSNERWLSVRIYEHVGDGYVLLGEVSGTQTWAVIRNVTPGRHCYVARSFNGQWESGNSNEACTAGIPRAPEDVAVKGDGSDGRK